MAELKNILDEEIIPLRKADPLPGNSSEDVDVSLPPPDDDKDIEYGLRLLSVHNFEQKGSMVSLDETMRKRIIASLVILGVAIFFLLLLWAIASFMPRKKQSSRLSYSSHIERIDRHC